MCEGISLKQSNILCVFSSFLCCSLLETHTGTKQANNLLGEHLHIAVRNKLKDKNESYFVLGVLHSQPICYFNAHLNEIFILVRVCAVREPEQ